VTAVERARSETSGAEAQIFRGLCGTTEVVPSRNAAHGATEVVPSEMRLTARLKSCPPEMRLTARLKPRPFKAKAASKASDKSVRPTLSELTGVRWTA
jgi:hypothetical protein